MTDDRNDERGTTASNEETGGREGPEERRADPADRHAQDTPTDGVDPEVDVEVVDLQLLLEQIAASAGDPPEHGLAGVAARRRRRKRHRRGAVATAMTLAVVATLAAPFVVLDDHDDVTAGNAGEGEAVRAELPDAVKLTCARTGIDVPVASIRPQRDGLHVEVINELAGSTRVWVRAYDEDDPDELVWDSGLLYVERGRRELVQPVPPGLLTVGCRIGGAPQQRQVELVDVDGSYDTPELACDEDDQATLTDLPLPANEAGEQPRSYVAATEVALQALTQWDGAGVTVTQPRGYPEQRFGSWSHHPMTEVEKDGEAVALVYLGGDDEQAPASAPWTQAPQVDVCRSFLNDDGLLLAADA